MRLLLLIFSCWHVVAFAQDNDNFYFPDQLPAKADAESHAWTDAGGNTHADSKAGASAGSVTQPHNPVEYPSHEAPFEPYNGAHDNHGGHGVGGGFNQFPSNEPVHLPSSGHGGHELGGGFNQYPSNEPTHLPNSGHGGFNQYPSNEPTHLPDGGGHEFNGGFNQGYPTGPSNPPYQPYPSLNAGGQSKAEANAKAESNSQGIGNSKSTSNAQASSQNFGNGNVISNAISNTQTNGPNGEATASASAAAAGVTYVNGIPVATASAAASVASTAPGAGGVSSHSSSGGPQPTGPNFNNGFNNNYREPYYGRAPYPGLNNGPYNGPNNPIITTYDRPLGQQSIFYRSALDKNDDAAKTTEVEANPVKFDQAEFEKISKSLYTDNVTDVKIPESKSGTVIFKD